MNCSSIDFSWLATWRTYRLELAVIISETWLTQSSRSWLIGLPVGFRLFMLPVCLKFLKHLSITRAEGGFNGWNLF